MFLLFFNPEILSGLYVQNGEVNAAKMGNLRPKDGWSRMSCFRISEEPSCIMACIKSFSLLSKMIAKRSKAVDSFGPSLPLLNRSSSFLIKKCLLAYMTSSENTLGAYLANISAVLTIEIHSRRTG